jgi:hypothetical protein
LFPDSDDNDQFNNFGFSKGNPLTMKKHIPNFLTLMNLLSGCVGITIAFIGSLPLSAWFIGCAAVFDFLDGFSARLLHVKSDIGKQLDSLADIISFGLLPGVIMYQMLNACNNYLVPATKSQIHTRFLPLPFLHFRHYVWQSSTLTLGKQIILLVFRHRLQPFSLALCH